MLPYTLRHSIRKEDYIEFFETLFNRFLAGADYNAKHTNWGSKLISPQGRQLKLAMDNMLLHKYLMTLEEDGLTFSTLCILQQKVPLALSTNIIPSNGAMRSVVKQLQLKSMRTKIHCSRPQHDPRGKKI